MQGVNIYTIEGVVVASFGLAYYECFQSLINVHSKLDQWVFQGLAIASLSNLAFCTLPISSTAVQRHMFSLCLACLVAYTLVVSYVLTADLKYKTTPNGSFDSSYNTVSATHASYFLNQSFPLDPLVPFIGMGSSLAIIFVQTLVTAAAVSPNFWESPVTGPLVMISAAMCSPVRTCVWPYIIVLVIFVIFEIATHRASKTDSLPSNIRNIFLIVSFVSQFCGFIARVAVSSWVLSGAQSTSGPLAVSLVCTGIPVVSSFIALAQACYQLLQFVFQPASVAPTKMGRKTNLTPEIPTLQTAFFTSEARLFRPTSTSANWAPKKTS